MRLSAMVKKEFRQIGRDKRTLWLIIFFPALLLILFGYALSFDVKHVRTGVLDRDRSAASRELINGLTSSEYFDLVSFYEHPSEIDRGLDSGTVAVALVIPRGFEKTIEAGQVAEVQALLDGSNSQSATIFQGYVKSFLLAYSQKIIARQMMRYGQAGIEAPVGIEPRIWYNPELKSSMFLIPGLIVFILMITCTISTALSVVRERERGTIEQLMVSPLSAPEVILGKTIPYVFIALASTALILFLGNVVFGVPVKGSYTLLFFASLLFIISALAQGVFISTLTSSQQVAFMAAALSAILPSILLSGFVFPIRNMPYVIQAITYVVPARYFVELLRAILLKGEGLDAYWHQAAALAGFSFLLLAIAAVRMSRVKLV